MISLEDQFRSRFGGDPVLRIEAPGRVNLIGEHIDYLDGWVMPAAIEPRITLLAAPGSESGEIELWSAEQGGTRAELSTSDHIPRSKPEEAWLNYPIGVLGVYAEHGVTLAACRVAIFSSVPAGAGLGSSAALETATALLIEALSGETCSAKERALRCQKAEHDWVGVPCGIMDQLAVGAGIKGHVLCIDCLSLHVEAIPFPADIHMVVADSGVTHALAESEYGKRRRDCEAALKELGATAWREVTLELVQQNRDQLGERLFRRARHAVTEGQRVADFCTALKTGHPEELPALMRAGHDSLRDDYEVTCPELDFLVDTGFDFTPWGHFGSRMTGGGFGGATIHLIHESVASAFIKHLRSRYREVFDRDLNCFVTPASEGAHCPPTLSPLKHTLEKRSLNDWLSQSQI
ncbi:MAG: galactokinase [Verrucomicrobiaceae bacterium]|nr:galactokinase [Verrucomicrobiaceae bacterium]